MLSHPYTFFPLLSKMTDQNSIPVFQHDVPLSRHTTIGLGGPARSFIECRSEEEILQVLGQAARSGEKIQVLGGGSNLIFSDEGFPGIVLRIALKGIEWEDDGRYVTARVKAGEWWDEFVQEAIVRGASGIECLSGVPGSCGATPIQNVGAYGQEVRETIVRVRAIDRRTQTAREFSNEECQFGYRMSRFKAEEKDRWIVTEVTFQLHKNRIESRTVYPELRRAIEHKAAEAAPDSMPVIALTPEGRFPSSFSTEADAVRALSFIRETVLALRKRKSMVYDPSDPNTRSVGSFFMNPIVPPERFDAIAGAWKKKHPDHPMPSYASESGIKIPAAWLIEHAGFSKGYRRGGAGISANHTLALVNYGCTTAELFALADEIKRGVESEFGITLEREAIAVG